MGSRDSKIITTLRQRRQIERAIQAFTEAESEEELIERAAEIARQGEVVLPVLLAYLGASDPQLRGGLAHIARLLPREKVVPALRAAARDRTRSDRERMTAMTILERYLDEELGPDLFEGLADPETLALESLQEVLAEVHEDPQVLIEYLSQLEEEPAETALIIVRAARRVDPADAIELLRMLSLDPRRRVAQQALRELGSLRLPAAVTALRSLLPNLPATLKPLAERSLRKLQLSGVRAPTPDTSQWRALVSPLDSEGRQALWFLRSSSEETDHLFIGLLLNDQMGIQYALKGEDLPFPHLAADPAIGTVHVVRMPQLGTSALLLEASFDVGRAILLEAISQHLEKGQPLPMPYRFYCVHLWAVPWAPPEEPEAEAPPDDASWSLERAAEMLRHPAFHAWGLQTPWVYDVAESLLQGSSGWPADEEFATAAQGIAARAFEGQIPEELADRLRRMSRWLRLAGDAETARLALWTAAHLRDVSPASHPFLLRLAEAGLRAAVHNLARGIDLRRLYTM